MKKEAIIEEVKIEAAGLVGFSIGIPASTMSNIQCFT